MFNREKKVKYVIGGFNSLLCFSLRMFMFQYSKCPSILCVFLSPFSNYANDSNCVNLLSRINIMDYQAATNRLPDSPGQSVFGAGNHFLWTNGPIGQVQKSEVSLSPTPDLSCKLIKHQNYQNSPPCYLQTLYLFRLFSRITPQLVFLYRSLRCRNAVHCMYLHSRVSDFCLRFFSVKLKEARHVLLLLRPRQV